MEAVFKLENCADDALISALLSFLCGNLEILKTPPLSVETRKAENVKNIGEIITQIFVAVSSGVIVELVKLGIEALKSRKDYDKTSVIVINGKLYTLEVLEQTPKRELVAELQVPEEQ